MCMAMAALSRDGSVVVAVDTMRSTYRFDGSPPERDPNALKLWRGPWGFLTGTGSWPLTERVAADLVAQDTPWRIQQVIRREREQLQREQPHLWTEGFEQYCPDRTALFLVAKDAEGPVIHVYRGTGELAARYREGRTVWSFPPEIGPERRAAIQGRWEARVNRGEPITLDEMVRATAGAFDETWPHADTMSDRVAIATVNDFFGTVGLVADAEWLANASGIEYGERAIPAHQRFGPRPLTDTSTEAAHSADIGTVTAGTVEANVIIASDTFTASEMATNAIRIGAGNSLIGDLGPFGEITWTASASDGWVSDTAIVADSATLGGASGVVLSLRPSSTNLQVNGGLYSTNGDVELDGSVQVGGSGDSVGFYGSSGGTKPTITGSRGGNAALADLLTELEALGLITDSST